MSKRPTEAETSGERAVRAKVAEQQAAPGQNAAAAAAAAEAVDDVDLDELYQEHDEQQHQKQQQQQQPSPAAAAAAAAADGDAEADLDDLYAAEGEQQQQQQHAANPAAAAAAAEANGDTSQPPQQPAAAAAGAKVDSGSNAGSSKGGGGSSGGGRAPPTPVEAPDLPADLGVFSNAMLLVDKPKEWTSFDACNAIKKAIQRLGVAKVGHAGTLDPAATGLLIICTGSGTKSIEGFMAAHKEYSGTLKLGEGTPSLDAETEVEETRPWEHITDEQLVEAAKKLTGDIQQVPPMYSALHHNGKRLHELARAGETVERPARPVTITRFDVHRDPEDKQLVHFYVGCSKGTYIRTLGHDLATSLGSTGHLVALRREAIGDVRVDKAWQIEELKDKLWAAIRARDPDAAGGSDEEGGGRGGRRPRGNRGKGRRRGGGRGGGGKGQQEAPAQ